MRIAYLRPVQGEQEAERDAMRRSGVDMVVVEDGQQLGRPTLERCLETLRPGDVLVVWRLDRLAGTAPELLRRIEAIEARGATLQSLAEEFDSGSEAGRMALRLLGSLQAVERAGLQDRVKTGLAIARKLQVQLGRPPALSDAQRETVLRAVMNGEHSMTSASKLFGVSPSTISRLVQRARERG